MKVKYIMSNCVEQTVADATVREAADLMKSLYVGMLPVFDRDELVGVITDRDIVTRTVAEGREPAEVRVRDVMTKNIISCHVDDDHADAALMIERYEVRRLVVLNDSGKVVGICGLSDIIRRAKHPSLTIDLTELEPAAA